MANHIHEQLLKVAYEKWYDAYYIELLASPLVLNQALVEQDS
jgi:hypothetical protein